ncbi:MAG TPA: AbrB/MazE/SpoVT family DNA-binding domain-containing protein [Acidobacteriaceae bacterium]|nr:AbrB/MazE/SpoVT family DNA-binding domain-containing protein [Acidobacteriaceae bacterium]
MASATVTSKGQITIPVETRKALEIKPGDNVDFVHTDDGNVVLFARNQPVQRLKGMFGKFPRTVSIEEMNEAIAIRGSRLR